jgi:hypothetical protein
MDPHEYATLRKSGAVGRRSLLEDSKHRLNLRGSYCGKTIFSECGKMVLRFERG